MAQWTLWGATQLANTMISRTSTPPEEYYLALIIEAEPDSFISGMELDEPFEAGYERLLIPNDTENWFSDQESVWSNALELRFNEAVEDWGQISFWALCSSPTEGYVYMFGELADEVYVAAGDQFVVSPNLLVLEFSDIFEEMSHE